MSNEHRLKALRTALGYSQTQFANITGINQANISKIESGNRQFEKILQQKILSQFNVNPVWWATGEGEIIDQDLAKVPIYLWHKLEGAIIGYDSIRVFSDCTKLCDYTGPEFGALKKGALIGLRATSATRCKAGDLLAVSHSEGTFTGYFSKKQTHNLFLKDENGNEISLEWDMIKNIYFVVGAAFRFI